MVIPPRDQAVGIYSGSVPIARENDDGAKGEFRTGSLYFHLVQELAAKFWCRGWIRAAVGPQSEDSRRIQARKFGLTRDDSDGKYLHIALDDCPRNEGCMDSGCPQGGLLSHLPETTLQQCWTKTYSKNNAVEVPPLQQHSFPIYTLVRWRHPRLSTTSSRKRSLVVAWTNSSFRDALEHEYQCLTITRDEVGGYQNPETGDYYQATWPCGGCGSMIHRRHESVAHTSIASPAILLPRKLHDRLRGMVVISRRCLVVYIFFWRPLPSRSLWDGAKALRASARYHLLRKKNRNDDV